MNLLNFFSACLLCFLVRPLTSTPVSTGKGLEGDELEQARSALHGTLKEGDMMVMDQTDNEAPTSNEQLRWTDATIPYEIDEQLESQRALLEQGMQQYHDKTCVKFIPRTTEENYIVIKNTTGCSSFVGMMGGAQTVSLGNGCLYVGTVVHELGHAVGLYHEHNRSDRDDYIYVYLDNVEEAAKFNFYKKDASEELDDIVSYNYESIMHYGEYAFSKDFGNLKTMEANDGVTKLLDPYDRDGLHELDVEQVNYIYNCQ